MPTNEVFEYELTKTDPAKGLFVRGLTEFTGIDPDKTADSLIMEIDKLVTFFNKSVPVGALGSFEPDILYRFGHFFNLVFCEII